MNHQDASLLDTLASRLQEEEVFERDRKTPHTRALGLLLHHAGLSCRRTSQVVSLLAEPVPHNPISAWYRRAGRAGDLFREAPAGYHEELVVDETSLHIEDPTEGDDDEDPGLTEVFLWAALDPAPGQPSPGRSTSACDEGPRGKTAGEAPTPGRPGRPVTPTEPKA